MSTSYRIDSHSYQGRYMYLTCTQTPDISTNTSKIAWTLTVTGGSHNYYTTGPTTVTINGETVYYKAKTAWDSYKFPAAKGSVSGTLIVNHDVNGNASIAVSIKTNIYNGVLKTTSGTWGLDSIPRYAVLKSAPNFNDEENPTITFSNPAGNNVTKLQACISLDGTNADIPYREITNKTSTSFTFELTSAERDVLRAATTTSNTRTVLFYLRTYIGSSNDASILKRTLTIKNPAPTISPVIEDTNTTTVNLTGDKTKLIRYYSNAKVTIGASATKGATLKSKKVVCGESSRTSDGTISGIATNKFVFYATDSRGNTTTKTVTPTMVNYVKVTSKLSDGIPDAEGNMTVKVTGSYFNGYFGKQNNALNVYYRYKRAADSWSNDNWTTIPTSAITLSNNTYTATATVTGLDYQTAYTFQAYAKDLLGTTTVFEKTVKSTPIFDWGENDFKFNVPVYDQYGTVIRNGRAAYTGDGTYAIDPNTTLEDLCLTSHENAPKGAGYYYFIQTMFYSSKATTSSRAQIACPYNKTGSIYHRFYNRNDAVWSDWTATVMNSGPQAINGNLTVYGSFNSDGYCAINGTDGYPRFSFCNSDRNAIGRMQMNETTCQLGLFEYSKDGSGYRNEFYLPSPGNLTSNTTYSILTSKTHKKTVLWTNSSPSSTFAAQTITISGLSNYDAIEILYRNASDSSIYMSTGMIPMGYTTSLEYITTSGVVYTRTAEMGSTGVVFGTGKSGSTDSSKIGIPIKIYGIKGVT